MKNDQEYKAAIEKAIEQSLREIPLTDFYSATENAAHSFGVSLPELQRAVDEKMKG